MVSWRHSAAAALERDRRSLAHVLATVGQERRERQHPEVHEPGRPHRDRRRCGHLRAGHARDRGDVELDVVDESQEIRSIGRLDSMHLDVAPLDGLVQEPASTHFE